MLPFNSRIYHDYANRRVGAPKLVDGALAYRTVGLIEEQQCRLSCQQLFPAAPECFISNIGSGRAGSIPRYVFDNIARTLVACQSEIGVGEISEDSLVILRRSRFIKIQLSYSEKQTVDALSGFRSRRHGPGNASRHSLAGGNIGHRPEIGHSLLDKHRVEARLSVGEVHCVPEMLGEIVGACLRLGQRGRNRRQRQFLRLNGRRRPVFGSTAGNSHEAAESRQNNNQSVSRTHRIDISLSETV